MNLNVFEICRDGLMLMLMMMMTRMRMRMRVIHSHDLTGIHINNHIIRQGRKRYFKVNTFNIFFTKLHIIYIRIYKNIEQYIRCANRYVIHGAYHMFMQLVLGLWLICVNLLLPSQNIQHMDGRSGRTLEMGLIMRISICQPGTWW